MFDFHFSVPTEIYFGRACERKAGALMKQYADRVLLIYGSDRIFRAAEDGQMSLGQTLTEDLENAGCTVFRLGGVRPNADAAYIYRAISPVEGSMPETNKPPAMRVRIDGYTKKISPMIQYSCSSRIVK